MLPSSNRDRVVDVAEELVRVTSLLFPHSEFVPPHAFLSLLHPLPLYTDLLDPALFQNALGSVQ